MKSKNLVVKFEVVCETDSDNIDENTFEEKLERWKNEVEETLYDSICHWGEVSFDIRCKKAIIEDYDE